MTLTSGNGSPPAVGDAPGRHRPGLWHVALVLLAACVFWAAAAPFVCEAVALGCPVGRQSGGRLVVSVAAVPAVQVGLSFLLDFEIAGMTWLLHRSPPPPADVPQRLR